jgi:hypothetical protein
MAEITLVVDGHVAADVVLGLQYRIRSYNENIVLHSGSELKHRQLLKLKATEQRDRLQKVVDEIEPLATMIRLAPSKRSENK